MNLSKPDRKLIAGIVIVAAAVILAVTGVIPGSAALGVIVVVAGALGVYAKKQ